MHRVVPELIIENFRAGRYSGEFPAVGMFLDLSGFSTMTDALMQHGQHGAEVLAGLMHGVFDPLVESIFEYGGKIVGFAGDGIMALYPIESDEKTIALRALASANVIQRWLEKDATRLTVYGNFPISAKIGLAIGSVYWRILRSDDSEQATYYFRGSAVDNSAEAEHHAVAGSILLTNGLHEIVRGEIQTEPIASFHRFTRFRSDSPAATPTIFPPINLDVARHFMPEEVIAHDVRGEFRQVVNLFMRFPDLSDETLHDFMAVVFNLRRKYGGLLTRLDFGDKGCNMLMLWGAPVSYENDIRRALNFVIDLQAQVDFPITAGVTYYIAHAGYLGSAMCEDYTCYGWGVNLASRFMMSAPTGEIWVDDRIARRVSRRFDIDFIGAYPFKGFSIEQKVHRLRGHKKIIEPLYQGEMVGRKDELARLVKFIEPLWQNKFAGVLLVSGDAGIGKGRLVHEFRSSELFESKRILWAVCLSDQILRQSLNPFRSWLFRYFGFTPNQPVDVRKQIFDSKIQDLLASIPDLELARELERTRSVLGSLVDLHWDNSLYEQLDAEGRYNNTFLALIALFKAESLRQPVVLFLEDIQFTDADSKDFLPRLKRAILAAGGSYPIAMLVTSRPQGLIESLAFDLIDERMDLPGLSEQDIEHLAEISLGGVAASDLVSLLMKRSEGNPYFAEQFIRFLQEERYLEMSRDGWSLVKRVRETVLPSDIRAVLIARLDQLVLEVRESIQTASVLGREFEVQVLAQMLKGDHEVIAYVAEAEKASIWSPLSEMRYIFTHGLLRDAAYTMQMQVRRQELHALAVQALEELYSDDLKNRSAELAYHAENADLRGKTQRYYSIAGKNASELYQNSQALEYLNRALAYTEPADLETQFDLLRERVELFSRMGRRDLQLKDLGSLQQWAEQLKDADRIAKVLMLRSAHSFFIGNYQDSMEYAKQAENSSESLANTELALYTQVVWATSLLHLSQLEESMQRAQIALERSRLAGNRKEEGRILNAMGWIALEQNKPADARTCFLEALAIAHEVGDPGLESRVLNHLAKLEGDFGGNFAFAGEYFEKSYKIAHAIGDRYMEAGALSNMGFAAGMQGDFELARSYHERSLVIVHEIGDLSQEIYIHINLSAVAGIQNQVETALKQAQQAVGLAQKISERSGEAWAMLYVGHAYLLQHEFELAKKAYYKSIEIRNELDQPKLSMEPIAGLVETYLATNDLESAAREAEKILHYIESGSTFDGADEPLRIYYACHLFLERKKDPRARQILQTAINLLDVQVSKFRGEAERKRYIENIPWRRALRDAALDLLR